MIPQTKVVNWKYKLCGINLMENKMVTIPFPSTLITMMHVNCNNVSL